MEGYESDEDGFPLPAGGAAAPAQRAASKAVVEAAQSELRRTVFTEEALESQLHFEILQLQGQLFVRVGEGHPARLGGVHAAAKAPQHAVPAVSQLCAAGGGAAGEKEAAALAQRLALRTGTHVVLACSLPGDSPLLQAFAEKRLFQELKTLGLLLAA